MTTVYFNHFPYGHRGLLKVICLFQFPQCPPPHPVSHSKTHPEHILHGYCFHTNYHHLRYNKKYINIWSLSPVLDPEPLNPWDFLRDTVSSVTHKKLLLTTTDLMLTRWLLVASPSSGRLQNQPHHERVKTLSSLAYLAHKQTQICQDTEAGEWTIYGHPLSKTIASL